MFVVFFVRFGMITCFHEFFFERIERIGLFFDIANFKTRLFFLGIAILFRHEFFCTCIAS